ncbi:MAG: hypothetical protein HUK22_00945, partial [Thermoguttaceae bacterium]|nr:hypothetical protein [Thermoguttaceae bacterium]
MRTIFRGRRRAATWVNGATALLVFVGLFAVSAWSSGDLRAEETGDEGSAEALDESSTANLKLLDFPILFAKQHNYQGLHIYDTFYQWRPGGGIYVLENPSAPPEERRIRAVIDPTTPETLGEGVYFDPALSYDA